MHVEQIKPTRFDERSRSYHHVSRPFVVFYQLHPRIEEVNWPRSARNVRQS